MKLTIALLSLIASSATLANESQNQAMLDIMKSAVSADALGQRAEISKCLGKSETQVLNAFNKSVDACFAKLKSLPSEEFSESISACVEQAVPASLGVSTSQLTSCGEDAASDTSGFSKSEFGKASLALDKLYDQLDAMQSEGASKADIARITAKIESIQSKLSSGEISPDSYKQELESAEFKDRMNAVASAASKASEGTLHLITLPQYPNSKVIMHIPTGMKMDMANGIVTLPAATFYSSDSPATVVKFYQNKLAHFEMKTLEEGDVIFMKKIPQDFSMLKDLEYYATSPHVLIRSAKANDTGAAKDTKSFIEIAYSPKK